MTIDPNREALPKAHAKWNSHREMFDFPSAQTGFEAGWNAALEHAVSETESWKGLAEIRMQGLDSCQSELTALRAECAGFDAESQRAFEENNALHDQVNELYEGLVVIHRRV